ncbi:MAG TPA: beta-ketoacyl-ACP synthase, partial [Cutibacterium acnes]|nr:beta-ketoacyl-ACP synthase [Cutibacterium acnes]
EHLEEGLEINVVTETTDLPDGDLAALNNSFGFGGHNVTLAFTNTNATR